MAYSVSYLYQIIDKYSPQLKKIAAQTRSFERAIQKATQSSDKLRVATEQTSATLKSSGSAYTAAGRKAQDLAAKNKSAAKSVSLLSGTKSKLNNFASGAVSAQGAVAGLIGTMGLMSSGRMIYGYQDSVNQLAATTRASAGDMGLLTARAKELGKTTPFTNSQVLSSMNYLAMAGYDTNQILGSVSGTLELAAAANMDLGTAADVTTNVLGQMGMGVGELSRVNDVLAVAQSKANFTTLELYEAMKTTGVTAKNLGMPVEQIAGLLGVMANQGEKASIAGTLMRNALMNLVSPSGKQLKLYKQLGVNLGDYLDKTGKIKDFSAFIGKMKELAGAGKLTVARLNTLFGERGFRAMQTWLNAGSEEIDRLTKAMGESAGVAKEMAAIRMRGLVGMVKSLASAWEAVQIAVFESGLSAFIEKFGRRFTILVRALSAASPKILRFVGIAGLIAGAAGPALIVLGGLAAALSALISPIGGAIAGIALLSSAIFAFAATNENVRQALGGLWKELKNVGAAAGELYQPVLNIASALDGGDGAANSVAASIKLVTIAIKALSKVSGLMIYPFKKAMEALGMIFDTRAGKAFLKLMNFIVNKLGAVGNEKTYPIVQPQLDLSRYTEGAKAMQQLGGPGPIERGMIGKQLSGSLTVSSTNNQKVNLNGLISVAAEKGTSVKRASFSTDYGNLGLNMAGAF